MIGKRIDVFHQAITAQQSHVAARTRVCDAVAVLVLDNSQFGVIFEIVGPFHELGNSNCAEQIAAGYVTHDVGHFAPGIRGEKFRIKCVQCIRGHCRALQSRLPGYFGGGGSAFGGIPLILCNINRLG